MSIGNVFQFTNHEVYVLTSRLHGKDCGAVVTWTIPITLAEGHLRIAAALSKGNETTHAVCDSGVFAMQLLATDQLNFLKHFGLTSSRDVDKFQGLSIRRSPAGAALLQGTCGWTEYRVLKTIDLGDRWLTLAEATAGEVDVTRHPLRKKDAFEHLSPEERTQFESRYKHDALRDAELITPSESIST